MKNTLIHFTVLFLFILSCKGQDKDVKVNDKQGVEIYLAKCQNEYSTGEKTSGKIKIGLLQKKILMR